ncbi:MAG: hypothetical protein M1827_005425 [Pycnora praestabilis]|nr:MAG: hypothetical protein M1827_005425 [Pycnora praestabilis]
MLQRLLHPHFLPPSRILLLRPNSITAILPRRSNVLPPLKRTLIAPPLPNSGPLMHRRPDRALPPLPRRIPHIRATLIFIAILTASSLIIFNYQKSSSSVVNSTMYALRTNERARGLLGDEVRFEWGMPWIWGEMNQVKGRIDISFGVKGSKGKGWMRFRSERKTRVGIFETQEWSLVMEDGTKVQLLDTKGPDPFRNEGLEDSQLDN